MISSYILSTIAFAVVAIAEYKWQAIFGTVFMSLGHGFSEIIGLSCSTKYNRYALDGSPKQSQDFEIFHSFSPVKT